MNPRRASPADLPQARPMCPKCLRPRRVCYCAALSTIETDTRIVILQHPKERRMPIGTARMAHLCLPNSTMHVGFEWKAGELAHVHSDPTRPPVLLYPGPEARDILTDPPDGPVTLVVVDGTWSQAHTIVRDSPDLAHLPRYAFRAPTPSTYRIRREPDDTYVSTLEALMHVLSVLEGDSAPFRALLDPMRAMVDAQIAAHAAEGNPRKPRVRKKRSPRERLPSAIRERHEDFVLIFADANAWPYGSEERAAGDELVHWVAHRPASGETFTFVLAPRQALAPETPKHTELSAAVLAAGGTPAEFAKAFEAFLRPTDVLCSWGHHGLRLLKKCGTVPLHPFVDMRGAARQLTNAKPGSLADYAAATLDGPTTPLAPGRAGRRLGSLAGILESWQALA